MSEAVISRQPGPAATRVDIVAVVAAGTIGVSWTALFLARGLAVRVYDPLSGVEEFVRAELAQIAPTLAALGLPAQDLTDRLEVADSLESAVAGADAVRESGPEDLAIKHRLLADFIPRYGRCRARPRGAGEFIAPAAGTRASWRTSTCKR